MACRRCPPLLGGPVSPGKLLHPAPAPPLPEPRPAIERPPEVHLHLHGVSAEDIAAILRRQEDA